MPPMPQMSPSMQKGLLWTLLTVVAVVVGATYYLYYSYYLPSELRIAATNGDLRRVDELLKAKVNVNKQLGLPSNSVLNRAVEGGNPEVVEAVLKAGADLNAVGETGMTALMMAAFFGKPAIIEILIRHGAKKDLVEERHRNTALLIAIRKNHVAAVKVLLNAGADPNQGSELGDAPLCRAQSIGQSDIMAALVEAGGKCTTTK
jgi:ankyrin repeat protein